jgi:hypothetical protein
VADRAAVVLETNERRDATVDVRDDSIDALDRDRDEERIRVRTEQADASLRDRGTAGLVGDRAGADGSAWPSRVVTYVGG